MSKLETLRDNLCEELEKIARKDEINTSDLEIIDKLAHSIKNLDKVMFGNEMIDEYRYSFDGDYSGRRGGGRRGRDADNDGRYNEGRRSRESGNSSYERNGYNSRGRNSYDDNYSGHYDEQSIDRFKHMMQNAISEL